MGQLSLYRVFSVLNGAADSEFSAEAAERPHEADSEALGAESGLDVLTLEQAQM